MDKISIEEKSKSLGFISYSREAGFQIEQEAIDFISTLPVNNNYAVITIVGKSKTGKSFLLNQLLNNNSIFPTSSHLNNCSKGIRISTKLINANGISVLVLDTEGFGSLEGTDDRDSKLFMLSLLLSSTLIYNSVGTIDEQTLNSLSMIIEVVKMFEKDMENMNSMPSLFWILRDFTLKMEDRNGFQITPKEYLETSLEEQKGGSQTIYHKNRIRRIIKTLFTDRMCDTMVFPFEEGENQQIREQFLDDLKRLENKVGIMLNRKGEKKICNMKMNPQNFINATKIYVENFNTAIKNSTIPKIQALTCQLKQSQVSTYRQRFSKSLAMKKENFIQQICQLRLQKDSPDAKSQELKIIEKIDQLYENSRIKIHQLTGKIDDQELYLIKSKFSDSLYKQCEERLVLLKKQEESNNISEEEIANICQFLSHITNEDQLERKYLSEIENLKSENVRKNPLEFSNIMMRIQLSFLRRKVQLSKQTNVDKEKLAIQLEYAKNQVKRLKERNKELEEQVFQHAKQLTWSNSKPRQQFYTPVKYQTQNEEQGKNISKQKEKQNDCENSDKKFMSNLKSCLKVQSSPFYVPYTTIQNSSQIKEKIVRTLIKEDSKKNQYIEYVIEITLEGQRWAVNRKFKDFSELHNILSMMFPTIEIPSFCSIAGVPKFIDSNLQHRKEIVEQRRRELEQYLNGLLEIHNVRNSRIMQKFLKINKQYTII